MKKKSLSVLSSALSAALLAGAVLPAAALRSPFSDVTDAFSWADDAIAEFASAGIVGGVGDGLFAPDSDVTREQLAKMLVLSFGLSSDGGRTFDDVAPSRWSAGYISAVSELIPGSDPGSDTAESAFFPDRPATREEVAAATVRALHLDALSAPALTFADAASVSPALRDEIALAAQYGIVDGYDDGTFRPAGAVTRAEAVVILHRARALVDTVDRALTQAALAPAADGVTLSSDTPLGDITALLLEKLGVDADGFGVSASFAKKNDPFSYISEKNGAVYLDQLPSGSEATVSLVLTLSRGEASVSKPVTLTLQAPPSSFETFYYHFALLTPETQLTAVGSNQLSLQAKILSAGGEAWYTTAPVDSGRFSLDSIYITPDGVTTTAPLGGGIVSAVLGDKGTLRRIYYTPSDMNRAAASGQDGAMLTTVDRLEPNQIGEGYTFYRGAIYAVHDRVVTFTPIGEDGRAPIASTYSDASGSYTLYAADSSKLGMAMLHESANITVVDGSVNDAEITSARRGTTADLVPSTDGGENYIADFVIGKDGTIHSMIVYRTPVANRIRTS